MRLRVSDFHCGRCGTLLDGDTDEPATARAYRQALVQIVNVLGPDRVDCPENGCEGCAAESDEALRLARKVLRTHYRNIYGEAIPIDGVSA
jgi:hypothetical protein